MAASERVVLENRLVKVVRVDVPGRTKHEAPARGPRVVISLSDESEIRAESAKGSETIRRHPGDVVFRERSSGHTIDNTSDAPHIVIIVELKTTG